MYKFLKLFPWSPIRILLPFNKFLGCLYEFLHVKPLPFLVPNQISTQSVCAKTHLAKKRLTCSKEKSWGNESNLEIPFSIHIRIILVSPYIGFHFHLLGGFLYNWIIKSHGYEISRRRSEVIILTVNTTSTVFLTYSSPSIISKFSSWPSVNPVSICTKQIKPFFSEPTEQCWQHFKIEAEAL